MKLYNTFKKQTPFGKAFIITVIVIWFIVFFYNYSKAGDLFVQWQGDIIANSYEVQVSLDTGTSWQVLTFTNPVNCGGDPVICDTIITVPDSGLVLIRYAAKNNVGTAIRYTVGQWYNFLWGPPPAPNSLKVQ